MGFFDTLGLIFYGGPIALILLKKNRVDLKKINAMRNFFINEYGLFEIDAEYEYRYKKQSVSFFNSHGEKWYIPKKTGNKIYSLFGKHKDELLLQELGKIEPDVLALEKDAEGKINIFKAFHFMAEKSQHLAIDIDTEKYLFSSRAYNPKAILKAKEFIHQAKRALESLSPKLKIPIPVILVIGLVIGFAIVAQNLATWIGDIEAFLQHIH